MLPFVAMLLAIAVCPLWVPHWWESNRNKLLASAVLGLPVLAFYGLRHPAALMHTAVDYVSFILLLAGLFVISGGILLRGDLEATPATNTGFLVLGGVLASFVGTTGASMLLIRPLLQTNGQRTRVKHTVIFFIFIVSNVGGMLTPLGDPPLFLGHLAGVPFTWTFRLWPHWGLMLVVLLAAFFVFDSVQFSREPLAALRRDRARIEPLRVQGGLNAIWLVGVVLAVAFLHAPWREVAIVALAAASLWLTPRRIRRDNGFSVGPMVEVAVLFAGIFLTMIPALELLRLRGDELGVRAPWQFFWASGRAVVVPRQRADLSDLPGARPGPAPARRCRGRAGRYPGRDQRGRGGHGSQHLHRQRPQLHGEGHRRGGRREDAELLRLHALQRRDPAAALRRRHAGLFPLRRRRSMSSWSAGGKS